MGPTDYKRLSEAISLDWNTWGSSPITPGGWAYIVRGLYLYRRMTEHMLRAHPMAVYRAEGARRWTLVERLTTFASEQDLSTWPTAKAAMAHGNMLMAMR